MLRVLVVDDVPLNRALLRATLRAAAASCALPLEVVEAGNGQQAYELYKSASGPSGFAVIVMDCRMPVMDGWQATEHIRLLERAAGWPPVAVVACTTEDLSPGSPALQRCWDCGMTAAMGKALSKEAALQLLQPWAGTTNPAPFAAAAAPTAADPSRSGSSSRSSVDSTTCMLAEARGHAPAPTGGPPAPCGRWRAGSPAEPAAQSRRSTDSMDSESGCLDSRLFQALHSGLYSCFR